MIFQQCNVQNMDRQFLDPVHRQMKLSRKISAEEFRQSLDVLAKHKEQYNDSICQVVQACFIIEKGSPSNPETVRFVFPEDYPKQIFEVTARYTFNDNGQVEIFDDEYDSRKNQIVFSAASFEEINYSFDNYNKDSQYLELTPFEMESRLMRKRYVFGIVRPDIVEIEGKYFETEIIYGFVSSCPFAAYFAELIRIIQQEIKLEMLHDHRTFDKERRISAFSEVMRQLTCRIINVNLTIKEYPINFELKAQVCGLRLIYGSAKLYRLTQLLRLGFLLKKFNALKIVKILHYTLAEKNVLLVCKSRRSLNELQQAVRLMIYPFNWMFPIVYNYTPFFEPFFSSPFPIIIGLVNADQNAEIKLPSRDFVTVFADLENRPDEGEWEAYHEPIQKLSSRLAKLANNTIKLRENNYEIEVSEVAFRIECYVDTLRERLSRKGEREQNEFVHDFLETQMASFYIQMLEKRTPK